MRLEREDIFGMDGNNYLAIVDDQSKNSVVYRSTISIR